MSLLLDARKISRQAQPAQRSGTAFQAAEPGAMPGATGYILPAGHPGRSAGHNLFAAKSLLPTGRTQRNRNFPYALGGAILLLVAGMAYLRHADSASNTIPLRIIGAAPDRQAIQPAAITEPAMQNAPIAEAGKPSAADRPGKAQHASVMPAKSARAAAPQPRNGGLAPPNDPPIRITQQKIEPVDPLLRDAYFAYRSGKLNEARQMYLAMFDKDARNSDTLLGLAAIAQQRGETQEAVQYFGRVLALDPRNALANAGMSAISADDDHNEGRLEDLLREQGGSAVLHFALGNLYAGQSRWGEAQQAYFNAYTLESDNAEYAFNLAVSLDHLGQKKLAAQHYRRAIQLDAPHSAGFDHAQIWQRTQELAH